MYKLIIEDDEGKTTVVPISRDEITVGRKEGNNIRLTERNVSRHHARFSRHNGSISVEDLDSYNGVRINGDRISVKTPVGINVGDLIEIGDYHLAIQMEGQDSPGLAGHADESTQRVSMPSMQEATTPGASIPDEVTSRVQMNPPPVAEATQPGWSNSGPGAPVPLSASDHTPDPEPSRRAEPTAIIRTTDLPREAPRAEAPRVEAPEGARLVVISTALAGKVVRLTKDETVLGRTDDNDGPLDHRSVSRNHAKVVRDGARFAVVDLNSANGVLVNGEEYKRIDLRRGDVIELGHVKLRFVEAGETFSLTDAEIDRLRREDPPDDDAGTADATGVIVGRQGGAKKKKTGLLVAGGVVAVLVVAGAVVALTRPAGTTVASASVSSSGGGSAQQPDPPPGKDPVAQQDEPRKPPPKKDPPPRDPPRDPPPRVEDKPPPPPPEDKTSAKDKDLRSAQAAVRAGDFLRARELYLPHASSDAEARRGLEMVDREIKGRGQLDEALEYKTKDPPRALRLLESVMEGTKARERADQEVRGLKPVLVGRLLKDVDRAAAEGNIREAEAALEDAVALDPGSRDVAKARDRLEAARRRKNAAPPPPPPPPKAEPVSNKGGDAKKALEDCNRAILLGNFEDAVAKGKLALKNDPTLTEAHKLLGVAYARQAKYCDAKFHYKKYIELNPNSATVDRVKGILATPDMQACP